MMRRDSISVLVGAARDVLESLSSDNEDVARSTIRRWIESPSPLLRRLAVNGVRTANWMTADEKLRWLVGHDLLYDASTKHEVFELLAAAYSVAGDDAQSSVIKRAKQGIRAKDSPRLRKSTREYERYNLLYWLSRSAPNEPLAQDAFSQEQARHSEFAPREDPDLDIGEVRPVVVESSMTVEQLLSKRVGDIRVARKLIDFKDEAHWYDPERYAYLGAIGGAASGNPGWGLKLAKSLAKLEAWSADLWKGLVEGWSSAEADARLWSDIFSLLANHQAPRTFANEAGRLLTEFIQKQESYSTAVEAAERFSDVLWEEIASESNGWTIEGADWLTAAINHVGGRIAEFWIRLVSLRAREMETAELAERDRARFAAIFLLDSSAGEAGRILLASQFHFLLAMDREWTIEHVRPLFDWNLDDRGAEQAWDGYLTWARLNEAVIGAMLPMYVASFPHLTDRSEEWRRKFVDHLAAIAVRSSRNPVDDQWLTSFVKQTSVESRTEWGSHVAYLLRTLEPDAKTAQWEKWIRRHWNDRLTGLPRKLARAEAAQLAAWAVSLEPVFPDAVGLLVQGPAGRPQGYVYDYLEKTNLPNEEPASVLRFLEHVLEEEKQPFYPCQHVLSVLRRIPRRDSQHVRRVVNQLVGLGCDSAISLMK